MVGTGGDPESDDGLVVGGVLRVEFEETVRVGSACE